MDVFTKMFIKTEIPQTMCSWSFKEAVTNKCSITLLIPKTEMAAYATDKVRQRKYLLILGIDVYCLK